jgi:hypothetical protein
VIKKSLLVSNVNMVGRWHSRKRKGKKNNKKDVWKKKKENKKQKIS